jgi:predicted permease
VQPLAGRLVDGADDLPASAPVAVIGERLWRRKFGGNRALLGRGLDVDGVTHEVVGILPASFTFPTPLTEVWLPMRLDPAKTESAMFVHQAIGRLRDEASIETAQQDLQALLPRLPEEFPGRMTRASIEQTGMRAVVRPLFDAVVGSIGRLLYVVLGAVGFLLAIACANVANLFLLRAEGRRRELAMQRALGAPPGAIVLGFLAEGLVVAALGGLLGVALAAAGVRLLVLAAASLEIPRLTEVTLDATVLGVAAASTALAAIFVSGLAARRWSAVPLSSLLSSERRHATSGPEGHRLRRALVVTQVALALVLLTGSGLMAKSVWRLQAVPLGFEPAGTVAFRLSLPTATYAGAAETVRLFARALDDLDARPEVEAVGAASNLPLDDQGRTDSAVWVEDRPLGQGELPNIHPVTYASPGYFRAAGIPMLEGRTFERPDPPRVRLEAIVSRSFADRYWPGTSPLGRRVRIYQAGPSYTVVGVAGDVRMTGLDRAADQLVYCPLLPPAEDPRWTPRDLAVVVRSAGDARAGDDPAVVSGPIRRVIRDLDASLPVYRLRPLEDVVAAASARARFTFVLLGAASLIALALGAIGLYGVISYVVSLRRREIGVRLAMGAEARQVRRLVSRQAVAMTAVGLALGVAGSTALTRSLAALLFEVSPNDPLVLALAAALLLVVALAASWLPARRAAAVDPVVALRCE